LHRAVTNRGE